MSNPNEASKMMTPETEASITENVEVKGKRYIVHIWPTLLSTVERSVIVYRRLKSGAQGKALEGHYAADAAFSATAFYAEWSAARKIAGM